MFQPFGRQKTVRLTMGQALIKFLQMQYTEYDGEIAAFHSRHLGDFRPRQRQRLEPGALGIWRGLALLSADQ